MKKKSRAHGMTWRDMAWHRHTQCDRDTNS